jgi:hypothetical protein
MVSGCRAALTVALTVVGAVSCASASPDQGQTRAPGSSELQRTQPPITASASAAPQEVVPGSVRAACGHPGAHAVITVVPITIPRAQCDLTGVVVLWRATGVTVPREGGVHGNWDGISSSAEFGADVDPATGDVTFSGSES